MSSPNPPEPPSGPPDLGDAPLKFAGGCLAGAGAVVIGVLVTLFMLITVGVLLLYLTCGGH